MTRAPKSPTQRPVDLVQPVSAARGVAPRGLRARFDWWLSYKNNRQHARDFSLYLGFSASWALGAFASSMLHWAAPLQYAPGGVVFGVGLATVLRVSDVRGIAIDRLRHMLEAAAGSIESYTSRGRDAFENDSAVRDAILY